MTELTRRERLRRTALLCGHFIRNLAYHRAGRNNGTPRFADNDRLHITINGNFLDIAVLEWLKLFFHKEQHAWQNIVTDQTAFKAGLLAYLGCGEAEFESFIDEMRTYRDKFVAHLDARRRMEFPKLEMARQAAVFYHRYLLANETTDNPYIPDLNYDIEALYQSCEAEAIAAYEKCGAANAT